MQGCRDIYHLTNISVIDILLAKFNRQDDNAWQNRALNEASLRRRTARRGFMNFDF